MTDLELWIRDQTPWTGGPTCGLWPSSRGVVAAVVDADGILALVAPLPHDSDERDLWLSRTVAHHGPGLELVMTESLARYDSLGRFALECGYPLWIAPPRLVTAIARAAWWRPAPRQLAALLARMPQVRPLRAALRRRRPDEPRQMSLLLPARPRS